MTSITLGPFFDQPLHPAQWNRPAGSDDYRVTTTFDGLDLVNGGPHEAVDVGDGQGRPAPLLSPVNGPARGLYHFDTAIGIEFRLPDGWSIKCWHLSKTLPVQMIPGQSAVGRWIIVKQGQQVGMTGHSGTDIRVGKTTMPMPWHTHIELWDGTERRDIEPYLFGQPLTISAEDTSVPTFGGAAVHAVDGAPQYRLTFNSWQRTEPRRGSDTEIHVFPAGTVFSAAITVSGEDIGGNDQWLECRLYSSDKYRLGYVHTSVAERVAGTTGVSPDEYQAATEKIASVTASFLALQEQAASDFDLVASRATDSAKRLRAKKP